MKRYLLMSLMMVVLALPIAFSTSGADEENLGISGLKAKIANGNGDSVQVKALNDLAYEYVYLKPDSAIYYAKEGLELAEKIKWDKGVTSALNIMGETQKLMGNFPQAFDALFKSLKISEERHDRKRMTVALDCIGNAYIAQGEYRKGLQYLFEEKGIQEELIKELGEQLDELKAKGSLKEDDLVLKDDLKTALERQESGLVYSLFNISIAYQHLNEQRATPAFLDSSLFYQEQAYRIAKNQKPGEKDVMVPEMVGPSLVNLATIEELKGNHAIALAYYRGAIPLAAEYQDSVSFCQIYLGLAELYKNQEKFDSSYYYGKKGLGIAKNLSFTDGILNSCKVLSEAYRAAGISDSTVKYLDLTIATKDSLFNQEKVKQLQTLHFNEDLRQQEIQAEQERLHEEHMHHLQMLGVFVFVIFTFVTVLSLSRIRINQKIIEATGGVSVLMVFEFVSMFLHPIIEEWTHHSVILVFLILCGVASILVPLHHKLEHWMKHTIGKRSGHHVHSRVAHTAHGNERITEIKEDEVH